MRLTDSTQVASWLPKKYIPREFHSKFLASLAVPEVTVLYGARQVGKSAEVAKCMTAILDKGEPADVFYFNLDVVPADFGDPERFVNSLLTQRAAGVERTYVFVDEAQRLSNVGLFVKYIYDLHKDIKFVLTGSVSLEISQKIKEPLTGRKIELYLPPLNLGEILQFNGVEAAKIRGSFELTDRLLGEYLLFGGYPAVVAEGDLAEKKRKLEEIADSYLIRDVADLFGISDKETMRLVASFLARNIGGILSRDNLSRAAGVSKYEIGKILNALEKSFIVFLVRPFAKDKVKEMIHRPKVFFQDLGIRNALLRKLDPVLTAPDRGELFENFVGISLTARHGGDKVKYWRTNNQTEVDFVVLEEGDQISAFEAKYSYSASAEPKNLVSFRSRYENILHKAWVISKENYWRVGI